MQRWMLTLLASAALSASPVLAAEPAPAAPSAAAAAAPAAKSSVLAPAKTWFAPGQPMDVKVAAEGDVTLVLTDFLGTKADARDGADVAGGQGSRDLRKVFPAVETPGCYVLYAVPKGKDVA
ncbi:MAG TPA: hypothetical protein VF796_21145, partial [Humisphaera sp.]